MPKHRNITRDGNLKDGRIFKLATYILPRHPTRLYMLASDLAKEFGFRDSFLLFQRTQGLFRLVATDADKLFLINHLKVLPRMRKYAPVPIVSAKSAFRVFGHKLIQNGLPDIDQYYSLQDTDTESVMSSENEADVVSFIEPVVNVPLTEQGKEQVFKRAVNSALEFNSILNRNRLQEFYDGDFC